MKIIDIELCQRTLKELKLYCKKKGYKGYSKLKKFDLIEFIKNKSKSCKTCQKKIEFNEAFITHNEDNYEHLKCYKEEEECKKDCTICLENINDDFFITECDHHFHKNCINKWYGTSQECPNCRGPIYKILDIDGFVLKLDDKMKDNKKKLINEHNRRKKKKLKSKLETEFRLIIHNYLDYYIRNTTETREIAINTIYTMIDSLGFQ